MDALRTIVSALPETDPDARSMTPEANRRKAVRLTGQLASIVAGLHRIRQGKPLVPADPGRTHADDFLRMLTGQTARSAAVRAFDIALVLHADHEFNASTFAARVTAATLADLHAAITSAIAALKGPPRRRQRGGHGAAPGDRIAGPRGPGSPRAALARRRSRSATASTGPRTRGPHLRVLSRTWPVLGETRW
jgi:hypothetical protein